MQGGRQAFQLSCTCYDSLTVKSCPIIEFRHLGILRVVHSFFFFVCMCVSMQYVIMACLLVIPRSRGIVAQVFYLQGEGNNHLQAEKQEGGRNWSERVNLNK